MSAQGFPDRHTTTTTTSVVRVTRPYFDPSYIRTLPGILKVAQAVLDFICFICVVVGPKPWFGGAGWAEFVTIVSLIVTTVLLVMYLLHMIEILHVVPWLLVEMCYCALWSFFYLIAGSVLAAGADQYQRYVGYEAWGAASEMVYCTMFVIFYLFAGSFLTHYALQGYGLNMDPFAAAAFFAFLLMILYGFDCFLKFRAWRNGEVAQGGGQLTTTTFQSTTVTH